jgi:hypothetical protein
MSKKLDLQKNELLKTMAVTTSYYTEYSMCPDSSLEEFLEYECELDHVASVAEEFLEKLDTEISVTIYDVSRILFGINKKETNEALKEALSDL